MIKNIPMKTNKKEEDGGFDISIDLVGDQKIKGWIDSTNFKRSSSTIKD